jgi:hypothetical protein
MQADRAVSSVGEHFLDMEGVTGSNPVPPTIENQFFHCSRRQPESRAA